MSKPKAPEPIGTVVRRLRVVQAAPKTATAAQKKIVETGVGIFEEAPSAKDAAFIARELVLASPPLPP